MVQFSLSGYTLKLFLAGVSSRQSPQEMRKRRNTFAEDLQALWVGLEGAKNPAGMVMMRLKDGSARKRPKCFFCSSSFFLGVCVCVRAFMCMRMCMCACARLSVCVRENGRDL